MGFLLFKLNEMGKLKARRWDENGKAIYWATDKAWKEWKELCKEMDEEATRRLFTVIK